MAHQPPPLQLLCFGPPTVRVGGRDAPAVARRPRVLGLLIYLTLSPGYRRSRDHLTGVFWPDRPETKAKHSLNEVIRLLRRTLGATRIRSDDKTTVSLHEDGLDVDVLLFAAAAKREPADAVPLLGGEFLEGFHVKDAGDFDAWMMRERQHYQALVVSVLTAAADRQLAAADPAAAIPLVRRALAIAPLSEHAVRVLMQASAVGREPAAALVAYREFAGRLKADTGEDPPKSLASLAERIGRQDVSAPAKRRTLPDPPLVGREAAHQAVFEGAAAGALSGPNVTVVTGAPGMGRSRLLAECASRLGLGGVLILSGRCIETDQDASWSALRLLVRAGLPTAPGLSGARPDSVAALAGLAPALAERFPPREVRDVAEMGAALADALGAVAEERPVALLLDDAQWADGPSLAALGVALRGASPMRVVLVITAADGVGSPSRELLRLKSDVGRSLPGSVVRLDALGSEEIGLLVRALAPWCRDDAERDRLTRRVVAETSGIPFVAVTLLRGLAKSEVIRKDMLAWPPPERTDDASWPFSIPSLLKHAVEVQLTELGREEQSILAAATICDGPLDPQLIAHIAERSIREVERALAAAEEHRVIRFADGRYSFVAPLMAEVVRATCLPSGERRRLERRTCDLLESRVDLASRVLRIALMARLEPSASVVADALSMAREGSAAGMRAAARRALAAAERALGAAPDPVLHRQVTDLKNELRRPT